MAATAPPTRRLCPRRIAPLQKAPGNRAGLRPHQVPEQRFPHGREHVSLCCRIYKLGRAGAAGHLAGGGSHQQDAVPWRRRPPSATTGPACARRTRLAAGGGLGTMPAAPGRPTAQRPPRQAPRPVARHQRRHRTTGTLQPTSSCPPRSTRWRGAQDRRPKVTAPTSGTRRPGGRRHLLAGVGVAAPHRVQQRGNTEAAHAAIEPGPDDPIHLASPVASTTHRPIVVCAHRDCARQIYARC